MTTEQQNLAWASLTPNRRKFCRNTFRTIGDSNVKYILEELYGRHNLTSDPKDLNDPTDSSNQANNSDLNAFTKICDEMLDEALEKETPESMKEWIKSRKTKREVESFSQGEQKELNLCELLKGCEGEKVFSTFEGDMTIYKVTDSNIALHGHNIDLHCGDGFYPSGICQLYPSRALYEKYPLDAKKAWAEWAESRKPKRWTPQIGERIFWVNANLTVSQDVFNDFETQRKRRAVGNEFKTGKLAQQAAEGVKEYLQMFHEKNSEK